MNREERTKSAGEALEEFCSFADSALHEYSQLSKQIRRLEDEQEDYLHIIELGNLSYGGRAKVTTRLRQCRIERRKCKDRLNDIAPLVLCLSSSEKQPQTRILPLLQEVLGNTRKVERNMENRVYNPRVVEDFGAITNS